MYTIYIIEYMHVIVVCTFKGTQNNKMCTLIQYIAEMCTLHCVHFDKVCDMK